MKHFKLTQREVFAWTKSNALPSEPHQELMPWCGWFRPVASRKLEWLIAWPDEEHLHP